MSHAERQKADVLGHCKNRFLGSSLIIVLWWD